MSPCNEAFRSHHIETVCCLTRKRRAREGGIVVQAEEFTEMTRVVSASEKRDVCMNQTRRAFLGSTIGGVVLTITPVGAALAGSVGAVVSTPPLPDWQAGPGKARYRIDGGKKLRAKRSMPATFGARDLDGWPDQEDAILVLRMPSANRRFWALI